MTLAQVDAYARALVTIERERVQSAAIAARVAQADEKGWSRWLNGLDEAKL